MQIEMQNERRAKSGWGENVLGVNPAGDWGTTFQQGSTRRTSGETKQGN